jgi:hypothetical protein
MYSTVAPPPARIPPIALAMAPVPMMLTVLIRWSP